MIIGIIIVVLIALGLLSIYFGYEDAEAKGYLRAIEDIEKMIEEVRDGEIS